MSNMHDYEDGSRSKQMNRREVYFKDDDFYDDEYEEYEDFDDYEGYEDYDDEYEDEDDDYEDE